MASLSANERLFLIDMEKVKEKVEDWDLLTTKSDREKAKDAFYNLMGSAQAYLKDYPNKLKQVIDKIDGYVQQWNNWESRDSSHIKERLLQTVFPTVEAVIGFSEVNIPALSAARDAELTQATERVKELEQGLKESETMKQKAEAETLVQKAEKKKGLIIAGVVVVGTIIFGASRMMKKKK